MNKTPTMQNGGMVAIRRILQIPGSILKILMHEK